MARILISLLFLIPFTAFSQSIVSVVPDEAKQGEELEVTITGENTSWQQSTNVLFFSQGSSTIYADPQTVMSDTVIKGYFNFAFYHSTGFYDVEVDDLAGNNDLVLEDGFMLNEGDEPIITSVDPDSSQQVEFLTVTVTGEYTKFTQGSSLLMLKSNSDVIYPESQNVYNDSVMDGDFFFNPDHYPGLYDVKVLSSAPAVILVDGFTILAVEDVPELEYIYPNTSIQGDASTHIISGQYTNFNFPDLEIQVFLKMDGLTIYADDVTVTDSVSFEVVFTFNYNHPPGVYDLFVFDDLDGTMLLEDSFTLMAGPDGPQISSVDPDDAEQGQELMVTITGQNTNFTLGSATIKFKQGSSTIFPVGQNVLNDTTIEGDFDFTIQDPKGYYEVFVYDINGNWSVSEADGFYLYPYVFIEEFQEATIGRVYPNPVSQVLFIKRNPKLNTGIAIDILNMSGEIVFLDEMTANEQVKSINVTNIEPGVYLIHLRSAGQMYIEKIVIK